MDLAMVPALHGASRAQAMRIQRISVHWILVEVEMVARYDNTSMVDYAPCFYLVNLILVLCYS